MPSIITASQPVTTFPNQFVSPFGNDNPIPMYSSIPINNYTSDGCLPCVVCGNTNMRSKILAEQLLENQSIVQDGVETSIGI